MSFNPSQSPEALPPDSVIRTVAVEEWTVLEYGLTTSTNLVAAQLPAWHAVRADTQTAGRGRFQRNWISDEGGLWLSAVLPAKNSAPLAARPLVAGLAVCEALRQLGVERLRMRWPNDVMVADTKLAGLLIDQFSPALVVVGVGLNVNNRPEARDPALAGHVIRLADLLTPTPALSEVLRSVLSHLRSVWLDLERVGFAALLPRLNQLWADSVRVELDLDGPIVRGEFHGVDDQGCLRLREDKGHIRCYEPHQVRLLREIPPRP